MLNLIAWNRTVLTLNCILILNWIVWNGTAFDIETVFTLNWIAWNRTVYMYKNGLGINNLQWLICHKTKPTNIFSLSQKGNSLHEFLKPKISYLNN